MLLQLQKDWQSAITSNERKLVKQDFITNKNGERVIRHQKVLFKFRNVDAVMDLELFHGDEALPIANRRYRNTVLVPSTNKSIELYPREWKSPVDKMMAILIAFTKGRDHEDRVAIRRQRAVIRENDKVVNEYKSRLSKTSFDNEEINFVVQWLDNNSNMRKMSWNKTLLQILIAYHNYITGRGLIELGINLGPDAATHISRCYSTLARILISSTHQTGKRYLTREKAGPLFLTSKEVALPIYVVRSLFSKIWDKCFEDDAHDSSFLFVWVCDFLGAYYAKITGIPVDKHCVDIQQRIVDARNRRVARKLEGRNGSDRRFRDRPQGPIITIDAAYGDVLDEALEKSKKQNSKNRNNKKNRQHEEETDVREDVEEQPQPKLKRKLRPVVVTEVVKTPSDNVEVDAPQENLGSVSDAFAKIDLM